MPIWNQNKHFLNDFNKSGFVGLDDHGYLGKLYNRYINVNIK